MNNTSSTATGIMVHQNGLGNGINIFQNNTGEGGTALYVNQNGSNILSKGIDLYMDVLNPATGYSLFHKGTGTGIYTNLSNPENSSPGNSIIHNGIGIGQYINLPNTTSNSSNSILNHEGLGRGQEIIMNNTANGEIGQAIWHRGTSNNTIGQLIKLNEITNTGIGSYIHNEGLGNGQYILMDNTATNTNSVGLMVIVSGTNTSGDGSGGRRTY